jgi:hypothetical protein
MRAMGVHWLQLEEHMTKPLFYFSSRAPRQIADLCNG